MVFKARAQASFEYLVITAFMLVAAALIFVFALFSFTESANSAKMEGSITQVINYANLAASLGDGSRVYFSIEVPDNVQSFRLENKAVRMVVASGSGNSEIYGYAKPSLTPADLPVSPGRRYLSAEFVDGNVVVAEVA